MQDCYKKGLPIDSNTIQEKAKSLYGNLKQKEGNGSKAGELTASKEWFDTFRKRFDFENVKITGEVASAYQEAAKFWNTIKKIIKEKEYLHEQSFHGDKSVIFWKKKPN